MKMPKDILTAEDRNLVHAFVLTMCEKMGIEGVKIDMTVDPDYIDQHIDRDIALVFYSGHIALFRYESDGLILFGVDRIVDVQADDDDRRQLQTSGKTLFEAMLVAIKTIINIEFDIIVLEAKGELTS